MNDFIDSMEFCFDLQEEALLEMCEASQELSQFL